MDRNKRPARLLGLVFFLPLAVTGCRTIVPTKPAASPNAPAAPQHAAQANAPTDNAGSIVKTDFHRKVTTDQQFNVHLELGKQHMGDEQYEAALAEFKKSLEACSHTSGLRTGNHRIEQQALAQRKIGGALLRLGKLKEAEDQLKSATKLAPGNWNVWNDLGYLYYMQSRWADAERCLRRAAKLEPENPTVRTNLGFALAFEGHTAEALELLSRSSGKAVGHANLAYALRGQGRLVEARDEYQKALAIQPQLALARTGLARLDDPQGELPLAMGSLPGPVPVPAATNADVIAMAAQNPASPPVAIVPSAPIAATTPVRAQQPQRVANVAASPIVARTPVAVPQPIALIPAGTVVPSAPPLAPQPPALTAAEIMPLPAVPQVEPAVIPAVSEVEVSPALTPNRTLRPPATGEIDIKLRPTSLSTTAVAPTRAATALTPIPMPVPVPARALPVHPAIKAEPVKTSNVAPRPAAATPRVSPSRSIPLPVPVPKTTTAAKSTAKAPSIPMPVPVVPHLAPPVSERMLNATSLPATDATIRPVPSDN